MSTVQHLVYVGSYAAAEQPGIRCFSLDPITGHLAARGSFSGITNPSFLSIHPSARWLYAVSETSADTDAPGAVWALRRVSAPATLEAINQQVSGGDLPCHLLIDATGRWLLVTNYGSGSVGVLPIQPDGVLGELTDLAQHSGHSADPERQAGPHAHSTIFAPDGRFVIVADLGIDRLVVYAFNAARGRLQAHDQVATQPGTGPRHMAFQPDGRQLLVVNELNNTLALYSYDSEQGRLFHRQTVETVPAGASHSAEADLHIHLAGQRAYVSNRGHNSIAVFDVGPDQQLRLVASTASGGDWPRHFALTPRSQLLVIANQYSGNLAVLPVQPGSSALGTPLSSVDVAGAACVYITAR